MNVLLVLFSIERDQPEGWGIVDRQSTHQLPCRAWVGDTKDSRRPCPPQWKTCGIPCERAAHVHSRAARSTRPRRRARAHQPLTAVYLATGLLFVLSFWSVAIIHAIS